MRKRIRHIVFKAVLILGSWLLALSFSFAQKVDVTATLDTNLIRIGEQVKLHLVVKYRGDQGQDIKITWPELRDTLSEKVEIIDKTKVEKLNDQNDPLSFTQQQTITLTSFEEGFYPIQPVVFMINGDTGNIRETEALLLEVKTVEVDTSQAIKDIKGPLNEPFDWREAIPYVLWGLAILAAVALIVWAIIKFTKKKPITTEKKPKIIIPPHIKALEALNQLKAQQLWQEGKVKQYHSAISEILRTYIEERYKVNALEQTTEEILTALRSVVIDNESKARLKQVLTLADLVKFAKEQPLPQENEMSLSNAFSFVEGTARPEPPAGEGTITVKKG